MNSLPVRIAIAAEEALTQPAECKILNDNFSYAMQYVLGFLCLLSLVAKWHFERPRRLCWVFLLDGSKQFIAALWYHILNMLFAVFFSRGHEGLPADECAWYFVNFIIDTTFGLWLNFVLLRLSERRFAYQSGMYWTKAEDPKAPPIFDVARFACQLSIYLSIISLSKLVVVGFMYAAPVLFSDLGVMGTFWITNSDSRLFFVMVLTPVVMDVLFLWVTDEFLKHVDHDEKATKGGVREQLGQSI